MNKKLEAKGKGLSPGLLAGIILALFFGISLFLRVYLPYNEVFSGEWIKFTSVDAYYQMRLVDNLVHNFPWLTNFDPYALYPFGLRIDNIHFFNWLLAGISWVIGFGSPSQHTIDVVAVYFPAVLAALTIIPVYFIGKELFGRWAGVLSAGLIATLPGEFLGRSILGFTDHHIAEILFTTTAMMFLILAIKASRDRGLTLAYIWHRDWAMRRRPIIFSLLSGFFMGIYLITWIGGLLFVFIIALYFLTQFIIDHLRQQSTDYLVPVGVITFFTTLIIYVLFSRSAFSLVSLGIALLIPIVLNVTSQKMAGSRIRPSYYPLALVGSAAVAILLLYLISPSFFHSVFGPFDIFTWSGSRTILEMQPILYPRGELTTQLAWGNFNTNFFLIPPWPQLPSLFHWIPGLSLISLGILTYLVIKQGNAEKSVLVVWSLVILFATLGQRRFAYYFAINVALLTGYLSWLFLSFAGFKKLTTTPVDTPERLKPERARPKKRPKAGFRLTYRHINMALAVIIVFFIVFFPNIDSATSIASQAHFAPDNAWTGALSWLKENTPEPFDKPDFYYQLYEPPPPKERYPYPESAYGVMSWVDYGYWITRIAHRPVNLTPGPGGGYVAKFFLSQDEDSTRETKWKQEIIPEKEIIENLGASYIIIDHQMPTGKFWALASWAEMEMAEFFEVYYLQQEDGRLAPASVFYPEYYRSMIARLYNFDGQAVTPERSIVISYEEKVAPQGETIKLITSAEYFSSYEEANAYISSQESDNYRIVGDNPFTSPVPLAELKNYKLVYSSDGLVSQPGIGNIPSVKIFEYTK
jgi:oligosaccharyl transferase (archaeosortase A-associated)